MGIVVFNKDEVLELKNSFNNYNTNISNSLQTICDEITNIGNILNTPKANRVIPNYVDYYKNQISYVNDNVESFNTNFDMAINEYSDFMSSIGNMVGGNNDK